MRFVGILYIYMSDVSLICRYSKWLGMDDTLLEEMSHGQQTVTVSEEMAEVYSQLENDIDVDSVIHEFEKDPFKLADELSSKTE